jgi:hypothetical protein
MELFLLVLTLFAVGYITYQLARLRLGVEELKHRMGKLELMQHARQGSIKQQRASVQNPMVDHPRSTVRDTNDLPRTGRLVGGLKFRRVNGDTADE